MLEVLRTATGRTILRIRPEGSSYVYQIAPEHVVSTKRTKDGESHGGADHLYVYTIDGKELHFSSKDGSIDALEYHIMGKIIE